MPRLKSAVHTLTALAAALSASTAFGGSLFAPYTAIPTGSSPEAVAIGDVNADGRADVVLTTSYRFDPDNDYKLFVFLQDDSGALLPPTKYATAGTYTSRPTTVDIGDVDGDGLNDVVVGLTGSAIQVFRQSDGQLSAAPLIPTPYSSRVRIGDLNGDGRMDVAGIGGSGGKVGVFQQGTDGRLLLAGEYVAPQAGSGDLELGDVDNDTRTDIVVMSAQGYAYDNLAVLTQTSNGTFAPFVPYDLGGDQLTQGVGIGDVNGDRLQDVVVSYGGNRPYSRIAVFQQSGAGTLDPALSLPAYDIPEPVEVRDVNGDGRDDIVVLHGGWYRMGVYLQMSDGTLAAEDLYPIPYASHYNSHGLAIGDYDGDGKPDVAIADYNYGLVLLRNAAVAGNTPPVAQLNGPSSANRVTPVTFDGSGSGDADGDPLSYQWQITGPVAMAGTSPTFTASFGKLGTYDVTLTVSDGLASATASKTASVQNLNPTVSAGPAQTVQPKSAVNLVGSASDPDGSLASYQWKQLSGPTVSLKGVTTPTASFAAPSLGKATSATLTFQFQATDNDGGASSATTTVTVVKR